MANHAPTSARKLSRPPRALRQQLSRDGNGPPGRGPGQNVTGRLNRWQSNSPAAAELARLQPMSRAGPGPGPETLSLNRLRPELGYAARSRPRAGQPSPVPAGPGPGAAFSSEISTLALPVYINRFNFGTLKILKRIYRGTAIPRSANNEIREGSVRILFLFSFFASCLLQSKFFVLYLFLGFLVSQYSS